MRGPCSGCRKIEYHARSGWQWMERINRVTPFFLWFWAFSRSLPIAEDDEPIISSPNVCPDCVPHFLDDGYRPV